MRRPSVVLFTTSPIVQPRSGGQIRASALAEHYRASGFEVTPIAVFPARAYPRQQQGRDDLEFPLDDPKTFIEGVKLPSSDDVQGGTFVSRDEGSFAKLLDRLPARVDVIHLEQPWLLPVVQRLRALPAFGSTRLVYGSQNLEAPLKEAICRRAGVEGARTVALVAQLERMACQLADLTLAVSEADASALALLGARQVVLAPNGISAFSSNPAAVARWKNTLGGKRVALFVGSGHPPNAAGFIQAFGDALGFVAPDACVVAAGRVGEALAAHYASTRFPTLTAGRLHLTGEIDDEGLSALKALASIFLLPIFEGGGSNIKTSEAILSGRPIIATSVSLRGFERYRALAEVTIADDHAHWVTALRAAFLKPEAPWAPVDALRAGLLWQNTLSRVAPAVRALG